VVLSVVVALLINGFYVSYSTRITNWSKLVPGRPRVVVISTTRSIQACREAVLRSPAVLACEPIAIRKVFVASFSLDVWTYQLGTAIVAPFLVSGRLPRVGEVAVQEELAKSLETSPGSTLCFGDPLGEHPCVNLVVSGITNDPLWPPILLASQNVEDSDGDILLLAKLKPNTSVRSWLKWLSGQTKATGIPLEQMSWSLAPRGLGRQTGRPSSLADQLKLDLAALILIVVALGVANAIALEMIEQEAETALLRALGVRSPEIQMLHLLSATFLVALGVLLSVGIAYAMAWVLPDLVGLDFGMCVFRGSVVVLAVSLCATWLVVALWHSGSPVELLRRRPLVP